MELDLEDDLTVAASSMRPGSGPDAADSTHTLTLLGDGRDQRYLIDSMPLTIGRVPPADVVLASASVSRAHCRVALVGGQAVVTDLGSTNGTKVDGHRLVAPTPLQHGCVLQVAGYSFSYERRTRLEIEEAAALDRDMHEAARYVQSLLPPPIWDGPVRADWLFLPSVQLGGSAFGYRAIEGGHFAAYMIDSASRGTSAAMRTVALLNLLRQPALPGIDPREPAEVIAGLRALFPADGGNTCTSVWYGVFDANSRLLRHAAAGHYPAFLAVPGGNALLALSAPGPAIGLNAEAGPAACGRFPLPPGAKLLLMSDGACELIERRDGRDCELFLHDAMTEAAGSALPEPLSLHRAVCRLAGSDALEDDFSALVLDFA